ncbi:MAG TPA: L-seryl-tRNA(Sec) selenium transferase [Gemmatimonadaceae bacterium]|nr:L-seryl-tRNA(Sec) selenium transferase [Gemmatimonadaceae bacterium]
MTDPRRAIPSVSSLLERPSVGLLMTSHPRSIVVDAVRKTVDDARQEPSLLGDEEWQARIERNLALLEQRSLRSVINATGVILHTNLGRAPLADAAIVAIREVAGGYTNLEFDLGSGSRGSRYVHCVSLLRELTGAEDAIVVNNCAAALVLSLSAIARGKQVIISRGELVEIGGSFRVPDIMARSGAELLEIGTTNRTHVDDYVRAISARSGAIAKIHRSNFSQSGFVADVDVRALAPIAAEHGLPIVHDLGSGLMIDLTRFGLTGEPTARAALDAGATLVLMSGDKLLGGPQAGIILGSRNAVARLRQDPFARAMRVDKVTIAALTATLELYRNPDEAVREIPALSMIAATAESIRERCDLIAGRLAGKGIDAQVRESIASVGAGAFPTDRIESFSVIIEGRDAMATQSKLRAAEIPVIGRIHDGEFGLDLRSVPQRFDEIMLESVSRALS